MESKFKVGDRVIDKGSVCRPKRVGYVRQIWDDGFISVQYPGYAASIHRKYLEPVVDVKVEQLEDRVKALEKQLIQPNLTATEIKIREDYGPRIKDLEDQVRELTQLVHRQAMVSVSVDGPPVNRCMKYTLFDELLNPVSEGCCGERCK